MYASMPHIPYHTIPYHTILTYRNWKISMTQSNNTNDDHNDNNKMNITSSNYSEINVLLKVIILNS